MLSFVAAPFAIGAAVDDGLMSAAPDDRLLAALRTVGADWADDLDRDLGAEPPDGAQAQQLALARVMLADPQRWHSA
jgi:hypothetical protein